MDAQTRDTVRRVEQPTFQEFDVAKDRSSSISGERASTTARL